MAKPAWGHKHRCESCGTRFYDLMRQPAACPQCGAVAAVAEPKPRRQAPKPKRSAPQSTPAEGGTKLVEIGSKDDADEDSDAVEDSAELGGDEDVGAVPPEDVDERSQIG